tara:strand:- start:369 stop:590 length:222 start_codon:yes stop_codon:yes gene_type:complete
MNNIFTHHPNSIGESYFKHLLKSLKFSLILLFLSFKALVHAFLPFLYKTDVSDRIITLSIDLKKRKDQSKEVN